jgi:Nuclease-related domain
MLEIRRGSAVRSYENTFFREFAKNLEILFDKYSIDGLLIANSVCEMSPNLQIDSLLITENTICLIDFKNFGGDIILPQSDNDFSEGQWVNQEGERIRGGSYINPYKQLLQQKKAFTWVFHNSAIKSIITSNNERLNPSHVNRIVCFQKPINLNGEIPSRDELNFFITDSEKYLETIKDILDVVDDEVKLTRKSFDAFKEIFVASTFEIAEQYSRPVKLESRSTELHYDELYDDQTSALQEIQEFIKSDTDKIFILQGTTLSGKSHLLPFIKDIGFNNGVTQVQFFALSNRIILNLLLDSNVEFNSIYSYIYGGMLRDAEENPEELSIENDENIKLEIVPLKKSEDEDKAIFIVDEAQLVSDSYHQSIDLRFGSGKLLEDFIKFSNLGSSNRKIIFIGDKFQLLIGNKEENAISPEYFEERYKLATRSFQLIDRDYTSRLVKQALTSASGIRSHNYNELRFDFSDDFRILDKDNIKFNVENKIRRNSNFCLLCYSNSGAQKINLWIKKTILKNGEDVAEKDLLIINNNFEAEDECNSICGSRKIYNGQFARVASIGNAISEVITPKGKQPITLDFREMNIILNDSGYKATILSLENYRLSEKGEISEDEIIGLRILLNREISDHIKNNVFESSRVYEQFILSSEYKNLSSEISELQQKLKNGYSVKTKLEETERKLRKLINVAKRKYRTNIEQVLLSDTRSKYYRYKNAAHLRFAWALTVHKSISYKWDDVLFNVEQGENRGKTNDGYFRWMYTGLTRARGAIELINYSPITPLSKIIFKETNKNNQTDKNIYFLAVKDLELASFNSLPINKFNLSGKNESSIIIQLHQFVNSKLVQNAINIKSINHQNYQEIYEIEDNNGQNAKISFYYKKNGYVKTPTLTKSEPKQFGKDVIEILTVNARIDDFEFISDDWRKRTYSDICLALKNEGYHIVYVIQVLYKDTIKITNNDVSLIVDMHYNKDGFFTSVIPVFHGDKNAWDEFKSILNILK